MQDQRPRTFQLLKCFGYYFFVLIVIVFLLITSLNVVNIQNLFNQIRRNQIHGDTIIAHYTSKIQESADQRFNNSNICILSMHDGYKFWMKWSFIYEQNQMLYAMNHGYTYHLHVPPQIDQLPFHNMAFKKPWMIDYFLNQHIDMTYFLWIDGDAFFNDMTVSIEDRFKAIVKMNDTVNDTVNDTFIIIGQDHNGINNGVFLLKNSKWTRQFVANWSRWGIKQQEEWWDPHNTPFRDQSTLKEMIDSNHLDAQDHVLVLEMNRFNLLQSYSKGTESWIVHHPNSTPWSLTQRVIEDHSSCC